MLALDEMIDGGMIIECDPQQVGAQELLNTDYSTLLSFFCVIHFQYFLVLFSGGFKGGSEG